MLEDSRRLKIAQEGSRRLKKAQEGLRKLKKAYEGSRRLKNVKGERISKGLRYIIVFFIWLGSKSRR